MVDRLPTEVAAAKAFVEAPAREVSSEPIGVTAAVAAEPMPAKFWSIVLLDCNRLADAVPSAPKGETASWALPPRAAVAWVALSREN